MLALAMTLLLLASLGCPAASAAGTILPALGGGTSTTASAGTIAPADGETPAPPASQEAEPAQQAPYIPAQQKPDSPVHKGYDPYFSSRCTPQIIPVQFIIGSDRNMPRCEGVEISLDCKDLCAAGGISQSQHTGQSPLGRHDLFDHMQNTHNDHFLGPHTVFSLKGTERVIYSAGQSLHTLQSRLDLFFQRLLFFRFFRLLFLFFLSQFFLLFQQLLNRIFPAEDADLHAACAGSFLTSYSSCDVQSAQKPPDTSLSGNILFRVQMKSPGISLGIIDPAGK